MLGVPLGAPGVYVAPREQIRALTGVRMDVCAFLGVAPRGPAWEPLWTWSDPLEELQSPKLRRNVPVAVESWDEYVRLFGSFESRSLLPYAVASFFEQGGRRAYVVRIVPSAGERPVARATLGRLRANDANGPPVSLRARNEGSWGSRLRGTISFEYRAQGSPASKGSSDPSLGDVRRSVDVPPNAEIVASIAIDDGAGRRERFEGVSLVPGTRRYIANVLAEGSSLVFPEGKWIGQPLTLSPHREEGAKAAYWVHAFSDGVAILRSIGRAAWPEGLFDDIEIEFSEGKDRYREITPEDFFDDGWDPEGDDPASGVQSLREIRDVALVVAPDLYSPWPIPARPRPDVETNGAEFAPCVPDPPELPSNEAEDLEGLRLDPRTQLGEIVELQKRLVKQAAASRSFVALLDVPPGLSQRQILLWRARLFPGAAADRPSDVALEDTDVTYAAAYHPWLRVDRADDARDALISINPSAIAAGIVAMRENERGIAFGPANEIAKGVVDVLDRVSGPRHDELHPAGVNVYLHERDGVRLTAARTLARDPDYRQLSVRRLMTMLRKTLDEQMQWAVFEPNDDTLWQTLTRMIENLLSALYRANAFVGATEAEAFFVRCDRTTMTQNDIDNGRLICLVGVAPVEPMEFVVLRLARDGDGALRVEG